MISNTAGLLQTVASGHVECKQAEQAASQCQKNQIRHHGSSLFDDALNIAVSA
jgi:hypothetical protein